MNPLMSEERIAHLIDKAVDFRKSWGDGVDKFPTIRLQLGNCCQEYTDVESWHSVIGTNSSEDMRVKLFDLSLRNIYISNIKPRGWSTLQVNLKVGQYGRDSNFGPDTIDKLVSVMAQN